MTASLSDTPLSVSGVSAHYGKKKIFDDVSFDVGAAEVFGLIGLNGVGKTTLIRCILGLREAGGSITLFGAPCALPSARRRLVYLPEKFQPSPQLYGWEYLSILLAYFGQPLVRDAARKVASGLGLEPAALERKVKTYSKGMGQKLGIVGALLVNADLMILDEPMSGLDPRARVLLKDRLLECRTKGRSVFFSSHVLSDLEEICDRVGVIHAGKLIFLGTPDEFIKQHGGSSLERAFLAAIDATDRAAGG